jgi:hypothetical protein
MLAPPWAKQRKKVKKVPNLFNPPHQPINPLCQPAIISPAVNPSKVPTPVFDLSNDDHIMEDVTTLPSKTAVKRTTAPASHSSTVACHVDPFLVFEQSP